MRLSAAGERLLRRLDASTARHPAGSWKTPASD